MTSRNSMRLIAACLLVQLGSVSTVGDEKVEPKKVSYADIPERVQIVGKLGQPLGHIVTVRGKWTTPFPSKPGLLPVFVVTHVDGRLIDPSAEFDVVEAVLGKEAAVVTRVAGEEWELRGVETGGFEGFSDQVWEELGQQVAARPPRGFLTRFCYVKAKPISASKPIGRGKE